ncbi:hypothetical protein [Enterobacter hormaechei]|nr:hypothetical protein [Enterobacter hormaechei]
MLIKASNAGKNVRDIADNCLILRGITHPFASSLQKAVEEEFFP